MVIISNQATNFGRGVLLPLELDDMVSIRGIREVRSNLVVALVGLVLVEVLVLRDVLGLIVEVIVVMPKAIDEKVRVICNEENSVCNSESGEHFEVDVVFGLCSDGLVVIYKGTWKSKLDATVSNCYFVVVN